MNAQKDLESFFKGEPPGQRTNAVRWLQKQVMQQALQLPMKFDTLQEWEQFRTTMREQLPKVIGMLTLPPLQDSYTRARIQVGEDVICERVDIYADDDYSIPAFVFKPKSPASDQLPALVWSPGYNQDKWHPAYQTFAVRMAKQGFLVLVVDHNAFGESMPSVYIDARMRVTTMMALGDVIGISNLGLRALENMRCGEYLRSRSDVDPSRVALAGLCQGGMDTWLAAALDESFCAVAPICAASTYAVHMAEMASYQMNSDSSPFPFGILKVCDVQHLYAAIAPRPLLVRTNLPDNWWPVSGYDEIETLTKQIYKLYGAEDAVDFRSEVHEHDLTGPFADALESFLIDNLRSK